MLDQLGLSWEDDFERQAGTNHQSPTINLNGPMPLYANDAAPGPQSRQRTSLSQRWDALGGATWSAQKARSYEVSASFLQTITQVSQAWCRYAVEKPDNQALFRHATPSDGSASSAQAVQDNIRYLHLHMLGSPAEDADVQRIYEGVFQAHEADGTETAWVAVCSFMIRHPLWLSL